jgi:hypothetical protein
MSSQINNRHPNKHINYDRNENGHKPNQNQRRKQYHDNSQNPNYYSKHQQEEYQYKQDQGQGQQHKGQGQQHKGQGQQHKGQGQQHKGQGQQHKGQDQGQSQRRQQDIKYIDVTDGNSNFIKITIDQYIEVINSFELSMDALELCNIMGVTTENHWTIAVRSTLKFLEALRGTSISKLEIDLLMYYDIGISPVYSSTMRKSIAYIKWMLIASVKQNNINDEFARYVGLLAGVCLYFNEMDVINASTGKITKNYRDLCQNYTPIEF